MSTLRDHKPEVLSTFMGLYNRGDKDNTPRDHFQDCNNLRPVGGNAFGSRFGIGISQNVSVPLTNIRRIYNFPTQTASTLIVLSYDPNTNTGTIYHVVDSTTVYGPVLTITGMQDFAFLPFAGRGYISPFASQLPTLAPPTLAPALALAHGAGVDAGTHEYAVTFVTPAGETIASPLNSVTTFAFIDPTAALISINGNIPGGPDPNVLTAGATYHWAFTYSYDGVNESTLGPSTVGLVVISGAEIGVNFFNNVVPANAQYFRVYRTLANGSTYYLEQDWSAISNLSNSYPGSYLVVGLVTDGVISGHVNPPVSNGTQTQIVNMSAIPVSTNATVTSRKLYRTAAGGSQLKLLHTLADNTTTVYSDTNADSSLGANVPTTNTAVVPGDAADVGLQGEFVYVYDGLGNPARQAAGIGPTGSMVVSFGAAGHTDAGIHIFGIVTQTDTGYFSPPSILTEFVTGPNNSVSFGSIPTSGDPNVVARYLVATTVIDPTAFTGNLSGYDMFFVPGAVINNNTDTFLNNVSFYDADLLDDATYLFDNYSAIPAGAVLSLYNNRMVVGATYTDISLLLVSAQGQPEAISQVSGLIVIPLDGKPVTNAQELRGVLYTTKSARTWALTDNGDDPSTWDPEIIDNGLGTNVHGIATVLDAGSANIDYLLICTNQGVSLFNGRYVTPELSWKIEEFWAELDNTQFDKIQIVNDSTHKQMFIVLPDRTVLLGDYKNGMDPKNIRWFPWSFVMGVNTVAITDIDEIIFGADLVT